MPNHDNQNTYQIYYRPLHKWIEVTQEEKQNWERFTDATRKAQQRAGACCVPYKKSYKCDGLCDECEFRCIPKDAPQHFSIDVEMENSYENGISRTSFLADERLTTEISVDSMILNRLLTELKSTDPESYKILMVLAEGLSERAGADQLNMPRNTFAYKKNQLLKLFVDASPLQHRKTLALIPKVGQSKSNEKPRKTLLLWYIPKTVTD